jgi:hypothetical protein
VTAKCQPNNQLAVAKDAKYSLFIIMHGLELLKKGITWRIENG